jgi:hypothetical protein
MQWFGKADEEDCASISFYKLQDLPSKVRKIDTTIAMEWNRSLHINFSGIRSYFPWLEIVPSSHFTRFTSTFDLGQSSIKMSIRNSNSGKIVEFIKSSLEWIALNQFIGTAAKTNIEPEMAA